jgi:hypothetical protein
LNDFLHQFVCDTDREDAKRKLEGFKTTEEVEKVSNPEMKKPNSSTAFNKMKAAEVASLAQKKAKNAKDKIKYKGKKPTKKENIAYLIAHSDSDKPLDGEKACEGARGENPPKLDSKVIIKDLCFCPSNSRVNQCSMISPGSDKKCCWCSDKRTNVEMENPTVYIDTIGVLNLKNKGIKIPRDICYCPNCNETGIYSMALYYKSLNVRK